MLTQDRVASLIREIDKGSRGAVDEALEILSQVPSENWNKILSDEDEAEESPYVFLLSALLERQIPEALKLSTRIFGNSFIQTRDIEFLDYFVSSLLEDKVEADPVLVISIITQTDFDSLVINKRDFYYSNQYSLIGELSLLLLESGEHHPLLLKVSQRLISSNEIITKSAGLMLLTRLLEKSVELNEENRSFLIGVVEGSLEFINRVVDGSVGREIERVKAESIKLLLLMVDVVDDETTWARWLSSITRNIFSSELNSAHYRSLGGLFAALAKKDVACNCMHDLLRSIYQDDTNKIVKKGIFAVLTIILENTKKPESESDYNILFDFLKLADEIVESLGYDFIKEGPRVGHNYIAFKLELFARVQLDDALYCYIENLLGVISSDDFALTVRVEWLNFLFEMQALQGIAADLHAMRDLLAVETIRDLTARSDSLSRKEEASIRILQLHLLESKNKCYIQFVGLDHLLTFGFFDTAIKMLKDESSVNALGFSRGNSLSRGAESRANFDFY
ncbi:MAG: hypothetical protein JXR42_00355 [Gammaproteobacteria bacterium]|nr:hypothetical protein [Gammaproteobacteria bacterium]